MRRRRWHRLVFGCKTDSSGNGLTCQISDWRVVDGGHLRFEGGHCGGLGIAILVCVDIFTIPMAINMVARALTRDVGREVVAFREGESPKVGPHDSTFSEVLSSNVAASNRVIWSTTECVTLGLGVEARHVLLGGNLYPPWSR